MIKFLLLLLSLLPMIAPLGFTLNPQQEFCVYLMVGNSTAGYAIFHPGEFKDGLIEFRTIDPMGYEIPKISKNTYSFNKEGEHRFCAKNLEYRVKNASFLVHFDNISRPAEVGDLSGMDSFVDELYENLDRLADGLRVNNRLSSHQQRTSYENSQKLNWALFMKVGILFGVMIAEIWVMRYFVNRGKK